MWLNLEKVVLEATDLQLICIQEASKNVFHLTPVTFPCVWEARFVSTKKVSCAAKLGNINLHV